MDPQKTALKSIHQSDSGYSKSCTNSNSQRSGSAKSHPNSDSNSSKTSCYGGTANGANESLNGEYQGTSKQVKDSEHKKKKFKPSNSNNNSSLKNNVSGSTLLNLDLPLEVSPHNGLDVVDKSLQISQNVGTLPFSLCEPMEVECDSIKPAPLGGPNISEGLSESNTNQPLANQTDPINKINSSPTENGFSCVISMSDGLVLYTTPNLTKILGFPKSMWLGRSFTDFMHPKDRGAFSKEITTGVAVPLIDGMGKKRDVKSSLYVYFRKYKGLKSSGYEVVEKTVAYQAFHLSITFKNATEYSTEMSNKEDVFLVVVAEPVYSSYKVPNELKTPQQFVMRHTSECIFNHVDTEVVMNFGYFPQDMLGKSVFDFYHPEDMPFIKEIYESVMSNCQIAGSVYRSKPYRFATRNGDFAMVESAWSCFINPWSRRLEFITGLHRVMQGPSNPDVFEVPNNDDNKLISQDVLREAKLIQEEIIFLLKRELVKTTEPARFEVSTRCKKLTTFMETIMFEVAQPELKANSPAKPDVSVSERQSVILGGISPHAHHVYERDSSSETPPSYNQLNYQENLQRFFKSKPMTTGSDEAADTRISVQSCEPESTSQVLNQKCISPMQNSGQSGSGSAENLSSVSNAMDGGVISEGTSNDSYRCPHLTEELLLKHNVDMEKIMRQRHRSHRFNIKGGKESKKLLYKHDKENLEKYKKSAVNQGTKRSMVRSWDGDNHKVSKHNHNIEDKQIRSKEFNKLGKLAINENSQSLPNVSDQNSKAKNVNLWPPFSVSMTSWGNSQSYNFNTNSNPFASHLPGMLPLYCFQSQPAYSNQQSNFQVQYMPNNMMYGWNPIFSPPPVFCPPMTVLPYTVPPPISPFLQQPQQLPTAPVCVTNCNGVKLSARIGDSAPKSQPASIYAELGSAMGSAVSTNGLNRAMSECSLKDYRISHCSPDFPLVSPNDESNLDCYNLPEKNINKAEQTAASNMIRQDEESSYSSFYSSFLKTDTGSGSNDDSTAMGNTKYDDKDKYEKPIAYPARKCDLPWMETVSVTPDLIYRYQMSMKNLEDILEADLKTLKSIKQPEMVNNQLDQLYFEMELQGLSTKLTLEEGITSSSSSGEDNATNYPNKVKRRRKSYSSLTMIYEENAPFPSPDYQRPRI